MFQSDYNLPKDWDTWSVGQRVEWHRVRVSKEKPAHDLLEAEGLSTCFTETELRERLHQVRKRRADVERTIFMTESTEFQELWQQLNTVCREALTFSRERVFILKLQFRRKSFSSTRREAERLRVLKLHMHEKFDSAETIEGFIINFCDKHGVDPGPYLIVDNLREKA